MRLCASDLTAIQDIAFDDRRGWLCSSQLAEEGVPAFETGVEAGELPAAQLIEIRRPGRRPSRAGTSAATSCSPAPWR